MNNVAFRYGYDCLRTIYMDKAYSSIELNAALNASEQQYKPLITKLVYGVLDNDIRIEYIISKYAKSVKPAVMVILKIGVYSLLELSIPQYAVVNDCVALTKEIGKVALSGFVNATLKSISNAINTNAITYPTDSKQYLSIFYSLPQWAVNMLIKQYGLSVTESILSYQPDYNFTHLRFNPSFLSKDSFEKLLKSNDIDFRFSKVEGAYYIYSKHLSLLDDRSYTIQSLGSMLVCKSLEISDNTKVLDVCSAPGGKAILISQMAKNVEVTACDYLPHRVTLIEKYAQRMGVNINTLVNDATVLVDEWVNAFDTVLVDAPCSGLGVFYNKPDIKLFRKYEDVVSLALLQKNILKTSSKYVKLNGILLYSTCTILKQENQDIVEEFLNQNDNFVYEEIKLPIASATGSLQLLPHIYDSEGFFICKLRRIK